jgi:hypothetical protein
MRSTATALLITTCLVWSTSSAQAQPVGTFRWQQQPYCNVFTLAVVQNGGIYTLDGTDDGCGVASRQLAVSGVGFPNLTGSIGLGLSVIAAGGASLSLDVTLPPGAVTGTWRDSAGRSGAWVFTPGAPVAGAARPAPVPAFVNGLSLSNTTIANVAAPVAPADATNKTYVDTLVASRTTRALNLSAFTARTHSGTVTHNDQGCIVFDQAAGSTVRLDVPLPLGAVVSALTFKYRDDSASSFQVQIRAVDHVDGGVSTMTSVGTLNSTNGTNGIRVETLPLVLPAVTSTRSYYLSIPSPAHANTLAFCGVMATYTLP